MNAHADIDDRRKELDQFANESSNAPRHPLAPTVAPMAGAPERVFGAQPVAVYRDESRILQKLASLGAAAGDDWFYRFPVKSGGATNYIEGPSIKLANDVARIYGNCDVDVRVFDLGDSWVFYARFSDFETGYSLTRPYQQRKNQTSIRGDAGRALDIAFQIGASKAIRNVVTNALQTFADHAFNAARNSLVQKIGTDLEAWRTRTVAGIAKIPVDLNRVERVIGKVAKDWLAPEIAMVIAMMKAIADGMASPDETFPPLDAKTDEPQTSTAEKTGPQPATQQTADTSAAGQPASGSTTAHSQGGHDAQPEAGQAAPTTDAKTKTDGKPEKQQVMPESEAQYIAFANNWREQLATFEDAALGEKRWKEEKQLRNKCNVGPETRDELQEKLAEKVTELRKLKK